MNTATTPPSHTLLSVWAHPDDESFGPAGLFPMLYDQGVRTVVVTATRGEKGSVGEPPLATSESLAEVRAQELHNACEVMKIARLELWDYADGTLADIDQTELSNRILTIINQEQPDVVLTFGPDGIYGHPDHVAIHAATAQAFAQYLASNSEHEPPRLYYVTLPRGESIENDAGDEHPEPLPPTTILDLSAYAEHKRQALRAHATQHLDWGKFMDNDAWMNTLHLHRAYPPYASMDAPETELYPVNSRR